MKKGIVGISVEGGEDIENFEGERGPDRLRTAKRVEKLGGVEYF